LGTQAKLSYTPEESDMQQPNLDPAVERLGFIRAVFHWLQSSAEAQELMYGGNPVIGTILTANPTRLFAFLSLTSITVLLLPSLLVHVAFIKDIGPAASKWPWVGFFQRWNWSSMYVLILPLIFASTARLSRACPSIFADLTVPKTSDLPARVTKQNGSRAYDFVEAISKDVYRWYRLNFYAVGALVAILTVADVGLLAHGYFERLVRHHPFLFPDSDWSVAFQLDPSKYYFYGWTQRGPILNLVFDLMAYSAQTLAIFFGFFWIAKYWSMLNSFSKQLIDNNIDFKFNPWWSDPKYRMGLGKVGKLFNGFLFVSILFQLYVFGHRLQLISRAGVDLWRYVADIAAAPRNPKVLFTHGLFATINSGMWLLLIFVLLPAVVISWVPLLRFRRYLQSIIAERYESLEGDLKRYPEGSAELSRVRREWEEVNCANIWPNGDFIGWVFLVLMVILTIAAWFPPIVAFLVLGGGGTLLLKLIDQLRSKQKSVGGGQR
jgi:hypothetical protein